MAMVSGEEAERSNRDDMQEASADQMEAVDMSNAVPIVEHLCPDGTVIRGYLNETAVSVLTGRPLSVPPGQLLDTLYRAEVDGRESLLGLWTNLHDYDPTCRAVDFLIGECGVGLPGVDRDTLRRGGTRGIEGSPLGSVPRRRWPTLLCEVIHDLGGHADLPAIIRAIQNLPESKKDVGWQEEAMQALKVHRIPHGKQYFDVADADGQEVFILTGYGLELARRKMRDGRAPILSKYFAQAVDVDGHGELTDMELYALLFLATRLGRPKEAQMIYHRLPLGFPDEESYAMIPIWIEQAKHAQADDE